MLADQMASNGGMLFRWRSYLPLLMLPLIAAALPAAARVNHQLGDRGKDAWEIACICISVAGQLVRCHVVGHAAPSTSGRNTKVQRADSLNTTGMYSVVRHPLYFANFLVFLGMLMYLGVWWLGLIGVLTYWLYYERIMMAEESFLDQSFGDGFRAWAADTPAFIPRLHGWRTPALPLQPRKVLKGEYTTAMMICTMFVLLEAVQTAWFETGESYTPLVATLAVALALYLFVRFLKKRTDLLKESPQQSASFKAETVKSVG
jgi:protein-S-isoprenylcysteine O-methyltransferase Ste14